MVMRGCRHAAIVGLSIVSRVIRILNTHLLARRAVVLARWRRQLASHAIVKAAKRRLLRSRDSLRNQIRGAFTCPTALCVMSMRFVRQAQYKLQCFLRDASAGFYLR